METTLEGVFSRLVKPLQRLLIEKKFFSPTEPQKEAIPIVLAGRNLLLVAPTGTGKTEAAFLPVINTLLSERGEPSGIKILYITPLRALNRDMLERMEWWCKRLDIRLAIRHGDTGPRERSGQASAPPEVLITTPETLQAILPGWIMRRHLSRVKWVIVDEVHELAGEKRGSQLSIALERLRRLTERSFQVIGLSATIGTPERVAKFLVGKERACDIVKVPVARMIQLEVVYPRASEQDQKLALELFTYPEVAARLALIRRLVESHKSTLLFTNTRSEAEVLSSRFRVWDNSFPIGVHHGSLSKPSRMAAERDLKEGKLLGIVCTSSLELGIDIGRLDLVIQYNSPRQVTRLLQRVGRSGHRIGGVAKGVIITQDSDDTLEALVIARRSLNEELEEVSIPDKPYDVLSHQIAGLLLHKNRWYFDEALEIFRLAYPYMDLAESELVRVLDYMHSRYPRLAFVSINEKIFAKSMNTKELYTYYFQNLSMIPEEKQYLVLEENGSPVGVLDEAFMAEHGEIGTKFVEGGAVWKILQVYKDKVYVRSEQDPAGAIPSWIGEEIPVPYEIAAEVGLIRRHVKDEFAKGQNFKRIVDELSKKYPAGKDTIVRALSELMEQLENGTPIPTDRVMTLEKWKEFVVIQCCFGHQVNRTLSRILGHLISEKNGVPVKIQQDPYRIVLSTTQTTLDEIRNMIMDLGQKDLHEIAVRAIIQTGMFKRRLVHVAKKFGALARDAELDKVGLNKLVEGLRDTILYEEAVRTSLREDADVEKTEELLGKIMVGEIELIPIGTLSNLTPIGRIGLEGISRKSDVIPPTRMKMLVLQSAKARLLNEARTLICTNCWRYVETKKVGSLAVGITCPECSSNQIGVLNEDEERVRLLARARKSGRTELPKRIHRLYTISVKTASLVSAKGFLAALALSGRWIRPSDAEDILAGTVDLDDAFFTRILEAEKKALRRRYFPS